MERLGVTALAGLMRRGVFAERGYASVPKALTDLVGLDWAEARRRAVVAEQAVARVGLDGAALPARLAATARSFAAGGCSLRAVEVIARVLATPAAQRLSPEVWAAAEERLAAVADEYSPADLQAWGGALVETLDQDGPEPDDRPRAQLNELHLTRHAAGSGGRIRGRFDDPAMFAAIASAVDAHAAPRTADDDRSAGAAGRSPRRRLRLRPRPRRGPRPRRRTPAPERGRAAGGLGEPRPRRVPRAGRRPVARGVADAVLRRPGGSGGARRRRSTPRCRSGHPGDSRRAAAGDRGPRPGMRPLRASGVLVRDPPHRPVGARRPHQPGQLLHAVPLVSPAGPPRRLGRAPARRRPRVLPADVDRPEPLTPRQTPTPGAGRSEGYAQSRTVPSSPAEASVRPSGLNATALLLARRRPSGLNATACTQVRVRPDRRGWRSGSGRAGRACPAWPGCSPGAGPRS